MWINVIPKDVSAGQGFEPPTLESRGQLNVPLYHETSTQLRGKEVTRRSEEKVDEDFMVYFLLTICEQKDAQSS